MNPADLERLIDGELKRLPAPTAPHTLLPRVLAATVYRRPTPWYARPWLAWPIGWQAASLALVAAIGIVTWLVALPVLAGTAADWGLAANFAAAVEFLRQASVLARVSWRLVLEPVALLVFVLGVALSLGSALLWAMLSRVALGGASES